ncbi:MAG: metallophosphoesterase, partial [Verrucomicrobiota bacterium]
MPTTPSTQPAQAEVAPGILLDGRLALIHQEQKWLAVADTHYGYSFTMREAGGLFPLWGDHSLEERLSDLCRDHRPDTLIIAGDLVHGRVKRDLFDAFLDHLQGLAPTLVLIRGNHDRSPTVRAAPFTDGHQENEFFFHHGHLEDLEIPPDSLEITGHWHPAARFRDGAGLSLKLPAFVQEPQRWI